MTRASWGFAFAIGLLISTAAIVPRASATADRTQQFVLEFEMAASKLTIAEVFTDRGAGMDPLAAMTVAVQPSAEPRPYIVPLTAGRYRAIRFDPFGEDGDFILQNANIRDRYGTLVAPLDLTQVEPSPNLRLSEVITTRVVGSAPAGHGDPWLVFHLRTPIVLWLSRLDIAWFVTLGIGLAAIIAAAAYQLQRFDRPVRLVLRHRHRVRRSGAAIAMTGVVATLVSMYPLMFGRSLVTPNNGPRPLVYTVPPYVPSSTDTGIEDARGADVQATMWVTLPYALVQRAALADGEFPWWNRYSETGAPLVGQAQTSIFDPLQWIVLVGDLALAADIKYVAARFVFVTGVGVASLAATESLAAAVVVAGAAAFIGHFIGRLNDPIHFSIVYAPWILVAFAAIVRSTTIARCARAAAGLLIATTLLTFSSSVKETFALLPGLYLAGAIAVVLQASRTNARRAIAWKLALSSIAAVGAALLTAPHWLVFFETLSSSFTAYDRSAMAFANAPEGLAMFLGALVPGPVYPGLNPLLALLALLALLQPRHWWRQPLVAGCAVVALAWLAVAFGGIPERWLLRLPLLSRIHHIGSTFVTAALPLLLIVAAAGVTSLARFAATGARARAALAIGVGAACVTALARTADLGNANTGIALVACVWTGVLCYGVLAATEWSSRMRIGLAVAVAVALLLPSGLHLPSGLAVLDSVLMQPRHRATLTTVPAALMPARAREHGPARIAGINGVLQGGVPTYLGMEGVTGADALFSPHTRWIGQQFELYFPLQFRVPDSRRERHGPLFDLWGVRWIARPAETTPDRLELIERPSAWPRAFFVDRAEQHVDRVAFLHRLQSDSRPFASLNLRDTDAIERTSPLHGTRALLAEGFDYRLTANTTAFTITAPAAGVVVLNEGFWPGVTAAIGGTPADVFRVNETMRGVVVPAGTSRISFAYRPRAWSTALTLAAIGAAALVALALTPAFVSRGGRRLVR